MTKIDSRHSARNALVDFALLALAVLIGILASGCVGELAESDSSGERTVTAVPEKHSELIDEVLRQIALRRKTNAPLQENKRWLATGDVCQDYCSGDLSGTVTLSINSFLSLSGFDWNDCEDEAVEKGKCPSHAAPNHAMGIGLNRAWYPDGAPHTDLRSVAQFICTQYENARRSRNEDRVAAIALGRALHAVQDFYAHSNYVELWHQRDASLNVQVGVHKWSRTDLTEASSEGMLLFSEMLARRATPAQTWPAEWRTTAAKLWQTAVLGATTNSTDGSLRSGWATDTSSEYSSASSCSCSCPSSSEAEVAACVASPSWVVCQANMPGIKSAANLPESLSDAEAALSLKYSHACLNKDFLGLYKLTEATISAPYATAAYELATREAVQLLEDWLDDKSCRWSMD